VCRSSPQLPFFLTRHAGAVLQTAWKLLIISLYNGFRYNGRDIISKGYLDITGFRYNGDLPIRYISEGGSIKISTLSKAETIVLVIDNGPGIPQELHPRVFERFFRVLGTHVQGSGLGLAIVEQIINLHKGSVKLGTPIDGLRITVIFPTVTILSDNLHEYPSWFSSF